MGNAWHEGVFPFTELWDLKQPLLFGFFKAVISVFGKSIFMIRLVGALIIAVSGFFVYLIGKKISNEKVGFFSGILLIFASSLNGSFQSVMSEHIAVFFLMPGIYVLLSAPNRRVYFLLGGIFIGLSCLVRLNMAFVALSLGVFFTLQPHKFLKNMGNNFLFSIGFGLTFLVSFLNFHLNGYGDLWLKNVIIAPFKYANSQEINNLSIKNHLILILMIGILIAGFYYLIRIKILKLKFEFKWMILILAALGIELSFLKSGNLFMHYVLQILPFLSIFAVYLIDKYLEKFHTKYITKFYGLMLFGLICVVIFKMLAQDWEQKKKENFAVEQIADYLNQNLESNDKIYLTTYHLIYWFTDKKPLSQATTHPSNLTKTYLFPFMDEAGVSSADKLKNVLEQAPRYILAQEKTWYFDEALQYQFDQEVNENYRLVMKSEIGKLYERLGQ